jgi:hypothetical protein
MITKHSGTPTTKRPPSPDFALVTIQDTIFEYLLLINSNTQSRPKKPQGEIPGEVPGYLPGGKDYNHT